MYAVTVTVQLQQFLPCNPSLFSGSRLFNNSGSRLFNNRGRTVRCQLLAFSFQLLASANIRLVITGSCQRLAGANFFKRLAEAKLLVNCAQLCIQGSSRIKGTCQNKIFSATKRCLNVLMQTGSSRYLTSCFSRGDLRESRLAALLSCNLLHSLLCFFFLLLLLLLFLLLSLLSFLI